MGVLNFCNQEREFSKITKLQVSFLKQELHLRAKKPVLVPSLIMSSLTYKRFTLA